MLKFHSLDGLPALFWLHMNQGKYFSTWSKGLLTFCNIGILAIALSMVSLPQMIPRVYRAYRFRSAVWGCMCLGGLSMRVPVAAVGRVPIMLENFDREPRWWIWACADWYSQVLLAIPSVFFPQILFVCLYRLTRPDKGVSVVWAVPRFSFLHTRQANCKFRPVA